MEFGATEKELGAAHAHATDGERAKVWDGLHDPLEQAGREHPRAEPEPEPEPTSKNVKPPMFYKSTNKGENMNESEINNNVIETTF